MKLALLIVFVLLTSCGKFKFFKKSSQEKQNISAIYATGTLKISVYYEPGAEPYTDSVAGVKVWNVLEQNLKALFPGKTVIVPKDLSSMSSMNAQNQTKWSNTEIHDLGQSLGEPSSSDTTVLNIFFVNGHSEDGDLVIGLHLSGTKTLMIFKETVEASDYSLNSAMVKRYVEQSTLVHESGHAIGLVNNGLPMTGTHEDTAHRAHCSNPDCVMYWQNEGSDALKTFVLNRLNNPSLVMYDQACLKDVTSFK